MANTTRLTVRLSTLASRTPLNGPATSTRSGELTKAKPSPVTRWVPAPATTPIASRLTPARLTISPSSVGGLGRAGGREASGHAPYGGAPERPTLHSPTAATQHRSAWTSLPGAVGGCSVGRSGAPP